MPHRPSDDYTLFATDHDRQEFARLLQEQLQARNWRATDLARAAFGESTDKRGRRVANNRDAISSYLAGKTLPGITNRAAIAKGLGMAPEQFDRAMLPHMQERLQARLAAAQGLPPPRNRRAGDLGAIGCKHPPVAATGSALSVESSPMRPGEVHVRLDKWLPVADAARLLRLVLDAGGVAP